MDDIKDQRLIQFLQNVQLNQSHQDQYGIHEFSWNFAPCSKVLIVGKRKSGKTSLLQYALFHTRHLFSDIFIITRFPYEWNYLGCPRELFKFTTLEYLEDQLMFLKEDTLIIIDEIPAHREISFIQILGQNNVWGVTQSASLSKTILKYFDYIMIYPELFSEEHIPIPRSYYINFPEFQNIYHTYNTLILKLSVITDDENPTKQNKKCASNFLFYVSSIKNHKLSICDLPRWNWFHTKLPPPVGSIRNFEEKCKITLPSILLSIHAGAGCYPLAQIIWSYLRWTQCENCGQSNSEETNITQNITQNKNIHFITTWTGCMLQIYRYICAQCGGGGGGAASNQVHRWLEMLVP